MPYHNGQKMPDYPTSNVDNYVNTKFLDLFEPDFKEKILVSDIPLIASIWDSTYSPGDPLLVTIKRRVFLLSVNELNLKNPYFEPSDNMGKPVLDGIPLKYFIDAKKNEWSEGGYKEGDYKFSQHWLRSPSPVSLSPPSAAAVDKLRIIPRIVDTLLYIRPAFCIDGNTKIEKVPYYNSEKFIYLLR